MIHGIKNSWPLLEWVLLWPQHLRLLRLLLDVSALVGVTLLYPIPIFSWLPCYHFPKYSVFIDTTIVRSREGFSHFTWYRWTQSSQFAPKCCWLLSSCMPWFYPWMLCKHKITFQNIFDFVNISTSIMSVTNNSQLYGTYITRWTQ